jgi:hypothetical protein
VRRRAGAIGTRTVEVVHFRSGASTAPKAEPRIDRQVRSASWEHGFPTKPVAAVPVSVQAPPGMPVAHEMPADQATRDAARPEAAEPAAAAPQMAASAERQVRGVPRRVADPFDAADDGANCMRCGYAVEPARERRGLMTCGACG